MPAIVGHIRIVNIGSSGIFHIGDVFAIRPISYSRAFAGAGSFNVGDNVSVYNYRKCNDCQRFRCNRSSDNWLNLKEAIALNFYVNQSIIINSIKIDSITTSSVFQIGTAGSIKALSKFSNTGGFTEPLRPLQAKGQIISIKPSTSSS